MNAKPLINNRQQQMKKNKPFHNGIVFRLSWIASTSNHTAIVLLFFETQTLKSVKMKKKVIFFKISFFLTPANNATPLFADAKIASIFAPAFDQKRTKTHPERWQSGRLRRS